MEKVPKSEPEKEVVKSPKGQTVSNLGMTPGIFDNIRPWAPPPMSVWVIRRLNRYSFLTDHRMAVQIEEISHSCFDAVSRASEENNRLLPRLGYHRFRQLVIQTAREFFIIGDVFLVWEGEHLMILDPNRIQIMYGEYYLDNMGNIGPHVGNIGISTSSLSSRTRLNNLYHISRRLLAYDLMGSPIIVRDPDDPAVWEIPNIGIERYVSQFVDAWVNSNIMSGQ